jgi:hypothetical protein
VLLSFRMAAFNATVQAIVAAFGRDDGPLEMQLDELNRRAQRELGP